MMTTKTILLIAGVSLVSACDGLGPVGPDKGVDRGVDAHDLSTLVAGIWVDPDGCDHWIIDDGLEGYLSPRLTPDGLPVCSGIAPPEIATGPFKDGSPIADTL